MGCDSQFDGLDSDYEPARRVTTVFNSFNVSKKTYEVVIIVEADDPADALKKALKAEHVTIRRRHDGLG